MTDTRKQEVTITLTMEEWDSVAADPGVTGSRNRAYSNDLHTQTRLKIGRATPGAGARYKLAKREADADRPDILGHLPELRAAIEAHCAWFAAEQFEDVSHLGDGNPHNGAVDGLYHSMTPGGVLVFQMPEKSFAGRYPYFTFKAPEVDKIVALCGEVAAVSDFWNGYGVPSLSVSFGRVGVH